MAIDPLSSATRASKRNLLIAGALAVTYRAFDISIDKIPFSGLTINFDPGVFAFLLTVALIYFTATFTLYYYIDIRNLEPTPHEQGLSKIYHDGVGLYSRRYASKLVAVVEKVLPAQHRLGSSHDNNIYKVLEESSRVTFSEMLRNHFIVDFSTIRISRTTGSNIVGPTYVNVTSETDPLLFERVADAIKPQLRGFWWRSRLNKLRYRRVRFTVNTAYPFRNYFLDGFVPLFVAALAFLALYRLVSLEWLKAIAPAG